MTTTHQQADAALKALPIGELIDDVETWNPSRSDADSLFDYIELSAVDQDSKAVTGARNIKCKDAPSRARQRVKNGDILVSTVRPNLNSVARVPDELDGATASTGFCVLRSRAKNLDPAYLFQWVKSPSFVTDMSNKATGASYPAISDRIISESKIPLPPLAEQKRIAAILDKADAIRRKLQQSLRLSDDFLRSVFLDMFGDPVTNPKGWPVEPLSEGVESFDGGKNVNPIDTDRRDGMRVLKVSAVTSGEYLEAESKSFGEDFQVPADYIVKTGDLLISRANTAELVGAVAYVWNTSGCAMLPDKLWRFVWSKPARIHPLFMLHMARSEHFRKQLILRATGSSGSMKNIGKVKMLEIPIPLPPIALQNKFAAIVNKTQAKIQKSTAFLQEAETLFSTLQQRAFRGEL